jgi:hypothetical protein
VINAQQVRRVCQICGYSFDVNTTPADSVVTLVDGATIPIINKCPSCLRPLTFPIRKEVPVEVPVDVQDESNATVTVTASAEAPPTTIELQDTLIQQLKNNLEKMELELANLREENAVLRSTNKALQDRRDELNHQLVNVMKSLSVQSRNVHQLSMRLDAALYAMVLMQAQIRQGADQFVASSVDQES